MYNDSQISTKSDRSVTMVPDVTDFDLRLLNAHNRAREDPHSLIPKLQEMLTNFSSKEIPNLYVDPITG